MVDPRRRRPLLLAAFALLALFPGFALPAAAAGVHALGDRVQVTGIVTAAADGRPLAGVQVVLEVSRSYFAVRQLRTDRKETRRVSTTTNPRGEYTIEWPWDPYFNNFELLVGLPVRKGQAEKLEVLARHDLTQRLQRGTPVIVSPVVANAGLISRVRDFVAGLSSADENRVYQEMGKPDEVKSLRLPDRKEVTWWYFERGRMYRFLDGRLEQVVPFDPIKAF
jgi:hypothetical protein